jgi:phage-related protein
MPLGSLTEGGMTFPLQFPFTIAGAASAIARPGYIQVDGTKATAPVLRVNGPCANPSITHVGSGRTLTVQTTLAAGEWVQIDTRPGWRTVLRENGGGAPLTAVSRIDQFVLTPGLNEIRWNATDNTLTSTLAVTWWPAYKAL